jgi:hypothetical protein
VGMYFCLGVDGGFHERSFEEHPLIFVMVCYDDGIGGVEEVHGLRKGVVYVFFYYFFFEDILCGDHIKSHPFRIGREVINVCQSCHGSSEGVSIFLKRMFC